MTCIQDLLGCPPSKSTLQEFLSNLNHGNAPPDPEVKSYNDAVYFNYYSLGLSLLFSPWGGYKPKIGLKLNELEKVKLVLDSIDVYNMPKRQISNSKTARSAELAFSAFPVTPLVLNLAQNVDDKEGKTSSRSRTLDVSTDASGKEFVSALGEPDRKGGGAGPSSGSIGIWCEWSKDGIMVEFGGEEARGPQAWERGKDAVWKVITVFLPKNE